MSRRPSSGASFVQVASRTGTLFLMKWKGAAVGTFFFAMLLAIVTASVQQKVQSIEDGITASSGITWDHLHEAVDARVGILDTNGIEGFVTQMQQSEISPEKRTADQVAADTYIRGVGPWLLTSMALYALVFVLAFTFFLALATGGPESAYDGARRSLGLMIPMCFLIFWLLVRSLVWIPLVGFVLALYFIPRFAFAPVLYAAGETTVFKSFRESYARTKGHWVNVVLCLIGMSLVAIMAGWFGMVIVAVASLFSLKLGFFLFLMLLMSLTAWKAFFLTTLTASVA